MRKAAGTIGAECITHNYNTGEQLIIYNLETCDSSVKEICGNGKYISKKSGLVCEIFSFTCISK